MSAIRMQLSIWAMLGCVSAAAALAVAVGLWPTWHLAGRDGLTGTLVAAAIVLPVMLASAILVLRMARRGPGRAALAFIVAGLGRLTVVLTATAVVLRVRAVHTASVLGWVAALYLAMFAGEVIWLARALKRDASGVALGRIDRPSPW